MHFQHQSVKGAAIICGRLLFPKCTIEVRPLFEGGYYIRADIIRGNTVIETLNQISDDAATAAKKLSFQATVKKNFKVQMKKANI